MNLLNTIALPNQHVAHGQDYIAVYADGVVKTYRKNRIDNTVDLQPVTYSVAGVTRIRMSQDGQIIAVQTATQTIRLQNGVQTPFNNIGQFDIANTGHLIIVDAVNGAVQVITNSTTNLSTAVTDDDRVVCGRQGYMVYNTARTLLGAKFADVTFTNTPSAKEIVFALHVKDDKYAVFYKDGTATYDGVTRTVAGPNAGFREAGSHILSTDYKQDFYTQRFNPLSDMKFLRTFNFVPPAQVKSLDFDAFKLLVPGSADVGLGFDVKNNLGVVNRAAITISTDSPFGGIGRSLEFNGSSSILQTADSTDIKLGGADFTIELFVKITGVPGLPGVVYHKGGMVGVYSSYQLLASANNTFRFQASTNGTSYDVAATDFGAWVLNEWTHVAVTRKANVWRCFQNGKLQAKYNKAGSLIPIAGKGIQLGHVRATNFDTGALSNMLACRIHAFTILNYAKYTHNFVVDALPIDRTTLIDAPIAATPPVAGPGWTGLNIQGNYANKLMIALTPPTYLDTALATKTLPDPTFPGNGTGIQVLSNTVMVSTRGYNGDYKISVNGGQTWQAFTPPNGTSNAGTAAMFKGALYVQHNITGTSTTLRKFANLPALTYTDTVLAINDLMPEFAFDNNENAIVCSSRVSQSTALYISWNGSTFTPYETGIPAANSPAAIYYVGNNVFMVRRFAAPVSNAFIYVPPTQGAPVVLGTVPAYVLRVMQFTDKLAITRLGQMFVKNLAKRVDGYNATLVEAQNYYAEIVSTLNIEPLKIIVNNAHAPWYSQDKLVLDNASNFVVYEMKKTPDPTLIPGSPNLVAGG